MRRRGSPGPRADRSASDAATGDGRQAGFLRPGTQADQASRIRAPRLRRTTTHRATTRAARRPPHTFRHASLLAIAFTGAIFVLSGEPAAQDVEPIPQEPEPALETEPVPPLTQPAPPEQRRLDDAEVPTPEESAHEARNVLREFVEGFYGLLPRIAVALALLVLAGVLSYLLRPLIRRLLGSWEKGEAASALVGIIIWIVALGIAFSVLAGDARALLGLAGLVGLALSWSLQTPIESFTGWLMNSFKAYYRIGDRIAVGEVFGDVYKIDFLTTTVWEIGGPDKPISGEEATGALITFPNSEVLRTNIINFTRDLPLVWDEVAISVSEDSDLDYAARVFADVATRIVGPAMADPAQRYRALLEDIGFVYDVAAEPRVFFATNESYVDVIVRYLVPARERRAWASRLTAALVQELHRPEHRGRIRPGYPRTVVELHRFDEKD